MTHVSKEIYLWFHAEGLFNSLFIEMGYHEILDCPLDVSVRQYLKWKLNHFKSELSKGAPIYTAQVYSKYTYLSQTVFSPGYNRVLGAEIVCCRYQFTEQLVNIAIDVSAMTWLKLAWLENLSSYSYGMGATLNQYRCKWINGWGSEIGS